MKVQLNWQADGVIDSYNVYKSNSSIDVLNLPPPIANVTTKNYLDEDIAPESNYFYRVESVRLGIKKISEQISINTFSSAPLTFIASNIAGTYSTVSSISVPIEPHNAGDLIVIVRRGTGANPVGYSLLFNYAGLQIFYRIATSTQSTQTTLSVPITYGGVASIILRPLRAITSCEATYTHKSYTTSSSNVTTPAHTSTVADHFELDILHWSSLTSGGVGMTNSLNGQSLLASNGVPRQVGQGANFIVAGISKNTVSTLGLAATLGGGGYHPSNQTINAYTVSIVAR